MASFLLPKDISYLKNKKIQGNDEVFHHSLEQKEKEKRVMGIEPTYLAWKASVLPLNYTRISVINLSTYDIIIYSFKKIKSLYQSLLI